jgi:hypothetical protein
LLVVFLQRALAVGGHTGVAPHCGTGSADASHRRAVPARRLAAVNRAAHPGDSLLDVARFRNPRQAGGGCRQQRPQSVCTAAAAGSTSRVVGIFVGIAHTILHCGGPQLFVHVRQRIPRLKTLATCVHHWLGVWRVTLPPSRCFVVVVCIIIAPSSTYTTGGLHPPPSGLLLQGPPTSLSTATLTTSPVHQRWAARAGIVYE